MKIVFMGTPDFAVPSLRMLIQEGYDIAAVVTQPDRPKGRKKTLTAPPIKQEAEKHGLSVLQPQRLKNSPEVDQIKAWRPDLIVTAAYGQILPSSLLDLPRLGCINVHASLLPKYRGGAPIHQAIINGEQETGVTIMYMVEKLDAGDILTQVKVPIEDDDDVGSLHDKLSAAGATLLKETIPLLEKGMITPKPQDESQATFAPTLTREDEKIDWQEESAVVYNHIRGLSPFPGAYTVMNGSGIKVWQAKKTDDFPAGEAGQVYRLDDEGIGVVCGDGKGILLTVIQPSGKRKMNASDFLRGAGKHWQKGMKAGQ